MEKPEDSSSVARPTVTGDREMVTPGSSNDANFELNSPKTEATSNKERNSKLNHSKNSKEQNDVIERMKLKKSLGLVEGISMIVGSIIGSGIFVSPKGVIRYTGSAGMSLVVWAASGIVTMIGGLCFVELGTMIPESGGMYSYLHEAFGTLPAFLYMWITVVIVNPAGCAVISLTFANYLLQPFFECGIVPDDATRLIAAALVCFLSWVNYVNVKWVASVQNVFTVTKVLALVVLIVAGIFHLLWGNVENYQNPMAGTNWSVAAIATAFYQSLFSYGGWQSIYHMVEELKNPNRNIPLSIIISASLVTVVYILTNIAYLAVLTPAEMLSSNAVALSFASRMLGVMAWVMPLFVMCSTFGALNGGVFTQARLVFVGARKGQFPEAFSLLHANYFTPVTSILLNAVLMLLMFVTSDIGALINYSVFAGTVTQFACMLALFWFRYKQPNRERPFKVWLILPIIFTLISLFLMVMPLIQQPVEVGASIGVVCIGFPIYYFTIYREDISSKFNGMLSKLTYVSQLLFHGLPEDKED